MPSGIFCPSIQKFLAGFILATGLIFLPTLVHSAPSNEVTLQWVANTETDLAGYRLYQGTAPGTYASSIDVGNITTSTVSNLQEGETYYFAVTAYDESGNESYPSEEISISLADSALDVTPPSITLTSPSPASTVSGNVAITADVSDNVGVGGVQFQINGINLGAEDTTPPFSITWETTQFTPGQYLLTARARDAAGNTTTSDPISVTIPTPSVFTLSVSLRGSGSVISSPMGILCSSGICSASYSEGSTVTLTAKADQRWKFAGWTGACHGMGECVIQLATNQFVEATFSQNGKGNGKQAGQKK